MKKILFVLVATLTLASCTQKIGFVNTEKLIKEYKGTIAIEAEIKGKSEKEDANVKMLITAFQNKVAEYQKGASKMSAKARQQAEQQLGAEQQMIQQKQQQLQYQVQNEGQAAIKKIAEEVDVFIKDYGKKNGYQMIFGTVNLNGAVMYGDAKTDLTDIVLTSMNDNYGKEDTSEKKEEKKEEVKEEKKETVTDKDKAVETKKEEPKK